MFSSTSSRLFLTPSLILVNLITENIALISMLFGDVKLLLDVLMRILFIINHKADQRSKMQQKISLLSHWSQFFDNLLCANGLYCLCNILHLSGYI